MRDAIEGRHLEMLRTEQARRDSDTPSQIDLRRTTRACSARGKELEEKEGAYPVGGNHFASPSGDWVPLYEGKMVQAFDHRAASVVVNPEKQHRPPRSNTQNCGLAFRSAVLGVAERDVVPDGPISTCVQGRDRSDKRAVHDCGVDSRFWSREYASHRFDRRASRRGCRDHAREFQRHSVRLCRAQKIQGQHLNWFVVEQLPVVPPDRYATVRFGPKTAGEIVREAVLELTYTSHDMARHCHVKRSNLDLVISV